MDLYFEEDKGVISPMSLEEKLVNVDFLARLLGWYLKEVKALERRIESEFENCRVEYQSSRLKRLDHLCRRCVPFVLSRLSALGALPLVDPNVLEEVNARLNPTLPTAYLAEVYEGLMLT